MYLNTQITYGGAWRDFASEVEVIRPNYESFRDSCARGSFSESKPGIQQCSDIVYTIDAATCINGTKDFVPLLIVARNGPSFPSHFFLP